MKNKFSRILLVCLAVFICQLTVAQTTNINIEAFCGNCESVTSAKIVVKEGVNPNISFNVTMNYPGWSGYITVYEKDPSGKVFDTRLGNDQYVPINGGFHFITLNDDNFNEFEGDIYVVYESSTSLKYYSNVYKIEIVEQGEQVEEESAPIVQAPNGFSAVLRYLMKQKKDDFIVSHYEAVNHFYTTSYVRTTATPDANGVKLGYEGYQFFIANTQLAGTVPFYRYYNNSHIDHFYTTDYSSLGGGRDGYVFENILGYIYTEPGQGRVPLYRYYNSSIRDHFYTPDITKIGDGSAQGYVFESIAGYVITPTSATDVVAPEGFTEMHRYWRSGQDHFYTTTPVNESVGLYDYEGVRFYIAKTKLSGTVALNRYYNASAKNHFYKAGTTKASGYVFEGVEGYVYTSPGEGRVPLYRYYHSKFKDHFYTTYYSSLGAGKDGYAFEKIEAYVLPVE